MILVISPESWDGHFVSKHHYAIELAKRGHDVIFHGPPEGGSLRLEKVIRPEASLMVLRGPRIAPGLRFLPAFLRRFLEARWLQIVERLAGKKIDVVWLFENSRFFDMRFAGERLKIYHQVDLNQEFHPSIAARTADHVFCTSTEIREKLIDIHPEVRVIHHGVQSASFNPAEEADLFPADKVNCVYAGNMSMQYLDRGLILRCVQAYPDALFHFFGGFMEGDPFKAQLAKYCNVLLYGKVDASRMLPILSNADILMVTYQSSHFRDQSNPHKMMEYMMSGKVTVATFTSQYAKVKDLIAMCPSGADYVELLGRVIENIQCWNAPELMSRRRAFAADNTYSRQLDRIAEFLGRKGYLVS